MDFHRVLHTSTHLSRTYLILNILLEYPRSLLLYHMQICLGILVCSLLIVKLIS